MRLNIQEEKLLLTLSQHDKMTPMECSEATGKPSASIVRIIEKLAQSNLLSQEKLCRKSPKQIFITQAGLEALASSERRRNAQGTELVKPPTRDWRAGNYVPARVWVRNDGHIHLASHGVRC